MVEDVATDRERLGDDQLWSSKLDDAVQIITAHEETHTFTLNEDALEEILLHPNIVDKKVVVLSVAGAFRKGKSFLLNFFLRFLQKNLDIDTWVSDTSDTLAGFSWRGGSERETSGILIWKHPFIATLSDGEKVAVILMDTQGAFDSQSTVKDCATVFALSTMLSSFQIYNLSQNIQEDDLQHLQLFTEYGRLALEDSDYKPFQALLFLVRDWSFPYEAEYGFAGGLRLLEKRLQVSDKQHPELQQLRRHIKSCFSRIECFLMPHPGLKVATNPEFKGKLTDLESEFRQQLANLVPRLLLPENLILKEINGAKVTCRELCEYFRVYIRIFQGQELPEPKSMLLATAEANNLAAVASAKAVYAKQMEEECGGETPYMSQEDLATLHEKSSNEAFRTFVSAKKMGGEEYSKQFMDRLEVEITDTYENFVKVNNGKNLFRSAKTPAVLFVVLIVDYVIKELLEFFYLDFAARIFSSLLGVILLTIAMWGYVRYSGNFRELGQLIDDMSTFLWDHVLVHLSEAAVRQGVKHANRVQRQLSTHQQTTTTARHKND